LQVKNAEEYIFFAFFTGIAKFSNVGIFSELNNLHDISMEKQYATMFGYTEKDVRKYFMNRIENIAGTDEKAKNDLITHMKEYYDGYTFDGCTHVYNPYTIERFLMAGEFDNYWIETGRQQSVEEYFYKRPIRWEELDDQEISKDAVKSPRNVGMDLDPKIVLYQSGYMTIREIPEDKDDFKLVYPNHEVKAAMAAMMANNYFGSIADADAARTGFRTSIVSNNYEKIIKIFNNMFSNIYKSDQKLIEEKDSEKKENFFRGHIKTFLHGAGFFAHGEVPSNKGKPDVVAIRGDKVLVIEVKYVDIKPKEIHNNIVSQYTIESDCRDKLKDAISQLYNKNYFDPYDDPLHLAIVIDESRAARISHAAYNETAYRLDGKTPDFTKIGEVKQDGLVWKLSYTSEISASKEPITVADIRAVTISTISKDTIRTQQQDVEFSAIEPDMRRRSDNTVSDSDLTLCRAVIPPYQYASFENGIKETGDESLINTLKRIAQVVNQTKPASFWHALSQEEKIKAFPDALKAKTTVMLSYLTQDGTFSLTAIDFSRGEAIGLLVTSTRRAAYGPYPLSRLVDDSSRLQSSFVKASLSYICKEQGVDETLPLPTPQQVLEWDEKK
jgi:hypothetical protein